MNPPLLPTNFTPLTFEEAIARARAVSVASIREWFDSQPKGKGLLFDEFREAATADIAIIRNAEAVPQPLWIVGDIHADVLALANIIEFAERSAPELGPPSFLFLGDFVDRGRHDHETLLLLFGLVTRHPARVCIIPGNHDVDLVWGQKSQKFGVTIQPAEYCERLNSILSSEEHTDREKIELAKLSIEFWKTRPKAVFLPDGTAFSHGGFPHSDLHDSLKTPADLCAKKCIDDFLWARLSESQKKRPNRGNRGHEFGWRDFAQFCRVMTDEVQGTGAATDPRAITSRATAAAMRIQRSPRCSQSTQWAGEWTASRVSADRIPSP
ncbi:MAG: metallophosphoesterase [Gemmataceae bacterium]